MNLILTGRQRMGLTSNRAIIEGGQRSAARRPLTAVLACSGERPRQCKTAVSQIYRRSSCGSVAGAVSLQACRCTDTGENLVSCGWRRD